MAFTGPRQLFDDSAWTWLNANTEKLLDIQRNWPEISRETGLALWQVEYYASHMNGLVAHNHERLAESLSETDKESESEAEHDHIPEAYVIDDVKAAYEEIVATAKCLAEENGIREIGELAYPDSSSSLFNSRSFLSITE